MATLLSYFALLKGFGVSAATLELVARFVPLLTMVASGIVLYADGTTLTRVFAVLFAINEAIVGMQLDGTFARLFPAKS